MKVILLMHWLLIRFPRIQSIDPSCECVIFDGFGGTAKNGSFWSPNFPIARGKDLHCLLYTFIGGSNERIELSFDNFELGPPDAFGDCHDFIRVYQELKEPRIDEMSEWQETLCGRLTPPAFTFYSMLNIITLEIHISRSKSLANNSHANNNFSGKYRFLNADNFRTSGNKFPYSTCDYHIEDGYLKTSSEKIGRVGQIFSPLFPYFYPASIRCRYWIFGRRHQHIKLIVHTVDVPSVWGSCLKADDSLVVYDGHGPSTGGTNSVNLDPLIGLFCGKSDRSETFISSGPRLYIEFKSGHGTRKRGKGFYATYEFTRGLPRKTIIDQRLALLPANLSLSFSRYNPCEYNITSEMNGTKGMLQSLNYPRQYPINFRCEYHFLCMGSERVQLVFTDFDLYYPLHRIQDAGYERRADDMTCRGDIDHLSAYVDLDDRMSQIGMFCGNQYLPPRLMSSRNQITLEFVSHNTINLINRNQRQFRGFQLTYNFVTDFAMPSGVKDTRYVCGFMFNSNKANNGTIQTPNYPGLYPRNVQCHYTFQGQPTEKVRIFFTYFDVDGQPPCEDNSRSDYLEFSNYDTLDLKMTRYCGERSPPSYGVESERDFFHLIFHSDAVFDATGFFAYYQFISQEPKAALKKVKTASSCSTEESRISVFVRAVMLDIILMYLLSH